MAEERLLEKHHSVGLVAKTVSGEVGKMMQKIRHDDTKLPIKVSRHSSTHQELHMMCVPLILLRVAGTVIHFSIINGSSFDFLCEIFTTVSECLIWSLFGISFKPHLLFLML